MKTFIIATILSVGVLLRPETATNVNGATIYSKEISTEIVEQFHPNEQPLTTDEMQSLKGAGIIECASYLDVDGDYHEMCCLNLWLFKICGDINLSAAERLIRSLL